MEVETTPSYFPLQYLRMSLIMWPVGGRGMKGCHMQRQLSPGLLALTSRDKVGLPRELRFLAL